MKIFNISFKVLLMGYVLFIAVSLAGCGDTFSQSASGHGTNIIAEQDVGAVSSDENPVPSPSSTAGVASIDGGGHLPAHCPIEVAPVEALVGCSVESFQECSCWDPTNPAQSG